MLHYNFWKMAQIVTAKLNFDVKHRKQSLVSVSLMKFNLIVLLNNTQSLMETFDIHPAVQSKDISIYMQIRLYFRYLIFLNNLLLFG